MARPKVLGTGIVVGVLWLIMAGTSIWSAMRGAANDRGDWALAWGLVGGLLLVAGLAAIIGSWWHENRVRRDH
jgi:hypothetical protein